MVLSTQMQPRVWALSGAKNAALDRPEPDAVRCPVHGGGRSSMVEPQIVILVVAGSSPVGHPIF